MDIVVDKQALCKQRKTIESSAGLRNHRIPNVLTVALNLVVEIFSWAEYLRYLIYRFAEYLFVFLVLRIVIFLFIYF